MKGSCIAVSIYCILNFHTHTHTHKKNNNNTHTSCVERSTPSRMVTGSILDRAKQKALNLVLVVVSLDA